MRSISAAYSSSVNSSIDEIAGVDAHLVGSRGGLEGRLGIEMHISRERHAASEGAHSLADSLQVCGLAHALRGEAHKPASGIGDGLGLSGGGFGVERRGIGHRLDQDRGVAAYRLVGDTDGA